MGWFRAMGADTVAYHQETVMGRGDDHPGQALDYYASRGETPLRWGDTIAARRLGLEGEVTPAAYEAAFWPGGFRDPLTAQKLVSTKRPGFEIVVAAHKTTALLGVIGRAEDMHAILDAETAGTMGWADVWFQVRGGRRGRAATVTPTTGLVYAVTRHGTTRAGDPGPHDHILIPNIAEMLDDRGGYKALYSALLRDTLEAATMVGRLHAAAEAVRRGHAIEADDGPSGRLRHWRIAGIPAEVCEIVSKRSDEIDEYLAEHGHAGYRARNVAARATRDIKRGTGVDELMPQWQAELEAVSWPVERLVAALEDARAHWVPLAPALTAAEVDAITGRLMDPDSDLHKRGKTFTRTRLVAEVAPLLYGHDPADLDPVIDRILASPLVVPLIGVPGAREQPYASAHVLATETAIADCIDRLADQPGPDLHPNLVLAAIAEKQDEIGAELSDGQYAAIGAVCSSGRAVDVLVGVAGSGKTTALDAAAAALTAAGYQVIGTATSGQAARTLGDAAGIPARTMRSLLWRLDHGQITLDPTTVVILDEAGMTADADLARLLLAVERAGAKVVIVGDDRQLSAIGPGGALHAVLQAHPEIVGTLTENLRQADPAEAAALLEVRSGDLDAAIGWYATNGHVNVAETRVDTLAGMVDAWAADTAAGLHTLLLAWQRRNVADLNRLARDRARQLGWLQGEDLETPDGRLYAVGDRVVTLEPNYRNQLVTSERGTITAIHPEATAVTMRTDDGRHVTLIGSELAPDRLAHGYALTVHREQGDTADRAHYLADGGGRELAYVALSRARGPTHVHAVADNLDQALDDLGRDWATQQHQTWITPDTDIGNDPALDPVPTHRELLRNRVTAELDALHALPPPDVTSDLTATLTQLRQLEEQRQQFDAGTGPYQHTPVGRIARQLRDLDADIRNAQTHTDAARWPWERRRWERLGDTYRNYQAATLDEWHQHGEPEAHRLDTATNHASEHVEQLHTDQRYRHRWLHEHPEHATRVRKLEALLDDLDHQRALGLITQPTEPATDPATPATGNDIAPTGDLLLRRTLDRLDQPAIEPPDDRGVGLSV